MGQNQSSAPNRSGIPARPHSPLRYGSVQTPQPVNPTQYRNTDAQPYMDNTFSESDLSVFSHDSFNYGGGSPTLSTISTLSTRSGSMHVPEVPSLYNAGTGRFMCPTPGCLYSILGYATIEDLDQHMSFLSHYPEPTAMPPVEADVVIPTFEHTDTWLSAQHEEMSDIFVLPPTEFTFTFEHPKQLQTEQPPPSPTTSNQCDCHHCQMQDNISLFAKGAPAPPKKNIKNFYTQTPMTIQLPPPPTIIGYPPPPPPPPSSASKRPPANKSSNEYAVWQQQIQIQHVSEMIQAQQKQRQQQRKFLMQSRGVESGSIAGEEDYSHVYGFPKPTYVRM